MHGLGTVFDSPQDPVRDRARRGTISLRRDPAPGSPAEVFLQGMEVLHVDPATGWGAFLAPVGELHLGFWHAGYGEDGRRVRVRAGAPNRFQLTLHPRPTLSLAFVTPEDELVYGRGHELEPLDGAGEAELLRQLDGRYEFTFEEAGRWRVVGAPQGWRQREGIDATVRVRPGEAARLDVPVVEDRDDGR